MKPLLRMGACAIVGVTAVLFVGGVLTPWLGGPTLFASDLGHTCRLLWNEQVRCEELITRNLALKRCLETKQEVVRELMAGRMTLPEAADRFQEAASRLADDVDEKFVDYQEGTEDGQCRNVIRWVARYLSGDPQLRDQLVSRLERELRQHRLSKGAI